MLHRIDGSDWRREGYFGLFVSCKCFLSLFVICLVQLHLTTSKPGAKGCFKQKKSRGKITKLEKEG
jgi:hypothetical protein